MLDSPPDGSADVDTAKVVGMRFSEPMNVTTLNAAGITLSDGQPVAAVVAPGGQGLLAYVLPEQPLSPGATYTVSINDSVTDPAGNPIVPFSSQLTAVATDFDGNNTADSVTVTANDPEDPVLLLANPESGTDPLEVQFSILTDLNAVPVSITLDADGDGTYNNPCQAWLFGLPIIKIMPSPAYFLLIHPSTNGSNSSQG